MADPKKEETNKPKVSLQDIYDGYAKKATADKDYEVDIAKLYPVEFTGDFLNIRKGHKQSVSKVMYDWYNANGVVKIVKAKNEEE